MTPDELEMYHKLRKEGKTHWVALGIVLGVVDP